MGTGIHSYVPGNQICWMNPCIHPPESIHLTIWIKNIHSNRKRSNLMMKHPVFPLDRGPQSHWCSWHLATGGWKSVLLAWEFHLCVRSSLLVVLPRSPQRLRLPGGGAFTLNGFVTFRFGSAWACGPFVFQLFYEKPLFVVRNFQIE